MAIFISRLEGVRCGCIPLAPNKLVYPELYPMDCLYNSKEDLFRMLKNWCEHPDVFREFRSKFDKMDCTSKFDARVLLPQFLTVIQSNHWEYFLQKFNTRTNCTLHLMVTLHKVLRFNRWSQDWFPIINSSQFFLYICFKYQYLFYFFNYCFHS